MMNGSLRHSTERASSRIPAKDLLLAGLVSLALHALAIALILPAVGLPAKPLEMDRASEMKLSFVTLSSFPPSQVRRSENRFRYEAPEDSVKALPRSTAGTSGNIQEKRKKAPLTSFLHAGIEKTADHDSKGLPLAGPDFRTDGNETALPKPAEGLSFAGKVSGPALKSPERGGISAPSNVPEGNGRKESERALPSATARTRQAPLPIYPMIARQRGYEGLVLITAEILENGSTGQLRVKKSSGYAVLDQAALQAVKKWKFVPAVRNNIKIRTWGDIPIRFILREAD